MSKPLEAVSKYYNKIKGCSQSNRINQINQGDIKQYQTIVTGQINKMQQNQQFDQIQQYSFYNQKFIRLAKIFQDKSNKKLTDRQFQKKINEVFYQRGSGAAVIKNSYLNEAPKDSKITGEQPIKNEKLQSFFEQKRSKIMPDIGFKSLLQNPPISSRNFKKRNDKNNQQMSKLKQQNLQLKKQIYNSKLLLNNNNNFQNLQIEIKKQQQRIKNLQYENDVLSKDNLKLKSQKSVSASPIVNSSPQYDTYNYIPYTINPMENDLARINQRNASDVDTRSIYNQNFDNGSNYNYNNNNYNNNYNNYNNYNSYSNYNKDNNYNNDNKRGSYYQISDFNLPSFGRPNMKVMNANNFQNRSDIAEYDKNRESFNVFDAQHGQNVQYGGHQDENFPKKSNSYGIDDPSTVLRNKIAFLKPNGIIIKQADLQIAYKRSQSNNLTQNRIILYFNNKINRSRIFNVYYGVQPEYYQINVQEKVSQIQPFKQARQVVEVYFKGQKQDINSLIQANISVDGTQYKIWLPTMFIRFSRPHEGMTQPLDKKIKVVNSSKIFQNENETKKLIPELGIKKGGEGYLWIQSSMQEGPAKIGWKNNNRIQIITSYKWIDFISFLLFDYH